MAEKDQAEAAGMNQGSCLHGFVTRNKDVDDKNEIGHANTTAKFQMTVSQPVDPWPQGWLTCGHTWASLADVIPFTLASTIDVMYTTNAVFQANLG